MLDVFAGDRSFFLLLATGELYAFGEGSYGELGTGETCFRSKIPCLVPGSWSGLRKISAGSMHTLGLLETGELFSWGCGKFGALGTGDHACVLKPEQVHHSSFAPTERPSRVFKSLPHNILLPYERRPSE